MLPSPSDKPSTKAEESWVSAIVSELTSVLAEEYGTAKFPAPAGWELVNVEPRTFKRRVPVVAFKNGERRLCFIVTPTDPREPSYRRTARHDVTYFSEDVADDAQELVYRRDREMIEAFAGFMTRRDGPARRPR